MSTIRPEGPADIEAVAALHVRAWQRGYAGILPGDLLAGLDPAVRARRRREALTGSPFTTLVAEDGEGVILGFVTFGPYRIKQSEETDPKYGEILAIYVDPDHWGRGVGGLLIQAALAALRQPEVRLWVLEKNEQAQAFYRKHGLDPDGVAAMWRPSGSDLELPELRFAITRRRDEKQG